jgi:Tol biopolymer transport system component
LNGNVTTSGSSRPPASVSPDGRFIAYTDIVPGGEKDLFIMSSDGKTSWPLVEHPAVQKNPRWSPDGKNIVFLSLRHGSWALWGVAVESGKAVGDPFIIQEGATGLGLLNWTSNGLVGWKWISIQDIFLLDVDPKTGEPAGEPKRLSYTPTGENTFPVWSPNGKNLAFLRDDDYTGGSNVIVLPKGGGPAKEFRIPKGYISFYGGIRWMPDSSGIGMVHRDFEWKSYVLRLNLSTEKWDIIPVRIEGQWTRFEWSKNGEAFLYSKNGRADEGAGIYEHNLKTGTERLIYSNPERRVNFRGLKCSRDYKWLAFRESGGKIMVVNLETGENHQAASVVGRPCWSPDGQKILTMLTDVEDKERKSSMFILPSSGGSVKEYDLSRSLPQKSRLRAPDWSPDGKQVVFGVTQGKSNVLLYNNIIPTERR